MSGNIIKPYRHGLVTNLKDWMFQDAGVAPAPPAFPIPTANLLAWYDATDSATITKAYVTKAQTATGTSGQTSFTTSADISADLFPNMLVRLNGTDVYTISSVVTTTVNIVGTLSNNYAAAALAVEGVSQWNDKSGNGNNATQATGAQQPGYVPNAVTTNAALLFFGGQSFILPSGLYSNLGAGGCTVFCSLIANQQDYTGFIFVALNSTSNILQLRHDNTSTGGVGFCHDTAATPVTQLATNTQWNVIRGRRSTTTQAITVNNAAETTAAAADNLTLDSARIGAQNTPAVFMDARVMDLIIYNASLSAPDIATVEQYMAAKCGVTLS